MAPSRSIKGPEYNSWAAMRRRCLDEDNEDYGGRGISYDPAWDDFEVFVQDMGPRPEGKTLDRIDPDGNYSRANCRWLTPLEQANNRRSSRKITHEGETLSVTEWSRRIGIKDQTLFHRLRVGWSIERALTTPPSRTFRGNQWTRM